MKPRIDDPQLLAQRSSSVYGNGQAASAGLPDHATASAVRRFFDGDDAARSYDGDSTPRLRSWRSPGSDGSHQPPRTLARLNSSAGSVQGGCLCTRAQCRTKSLRQHLFVRSRGAQFTVGLSSGSGQTVPVAGVAGSTPSAWPGQCYLDSGRGDRSCNWCATGVAQGLEQAARRAGRAFGSPATALGGMRDPGITSSGRCFDELLRGSMIGMMMTNR